MAAARLSSGGSAALWRIGKSDRRAHTRSPVAARTAAITGSAVNGVSQLVLGDKLVGLGRFTTKWSGSDATSTLQRRYFMDAAAAAAAAADVRILIRSHLERLGRCVNPRDNLVMRSDDDRNNLNDAVSFYQWNL